MGLVNYSNISDGTGIDAADVNNPFNTIYNEFNGNIDTINIKDSAVTTPKLADAAVTPAKLLAGTGSSWAWQSWTPTVNGISGTVELAKYTQVGKTVHFRLFFTASGAASAAITFSPPVAINTEYNNADHIVQSVVRYKDNGVGYFEGALRVSGTNLVLMAKGASSTYVTQNDTNITVPFTWANNDTFFVAGTFEAA